MGATSKQRTPSRCREWERERRNKFNQAIVKLGEVIKTTSRENASSTEADNTQYPKVEVIQRAIVYITDYALEKSKLKAEVLALQVKLDEMNTKVVEKKDIGTQISKGAKTKLASSKYNKMLMLKKCNKGKPTPVVKSSSKAFPSASLAHTTATTNSGTQATLITTNSAPNLPKLVPKSIKSKGQENTIVVVAATPYLIPQRPLMYPAPPPTFLLLNPSSMQTANKSSVSMLNRGSNDITRTTMVNVLPISAYSHPLSASKLKKNNNVKQKTENVTKKSKPIKKTVASKEDAPQRKAKTTSNVITSTNDVSKKQEHVSKMKAEENEKSSTTTANKIKPTLIPDQATSKLVDTKSQANPHPKQQKKSEEVPKIKESCDKTKESTTQVVNNLPIPQEKTFNNITGPNDKICKAPPVKDDPPVDKNKLSSILESTLCENNVDGGNARLELAEELLAASPTAAFLMSFPLVSGNRADSPAEEPQNVPAPKDNNQRRNDIPSQPPIPYFEKPNANTIKEKPINKQNTSNINVMDKDINQHKFSELNSSSKQAGAKTSNSITVTSAENPFLNLPMPSTTSTSCTLTDPAFVLDFDCNITKTLPNQTTSYANSSIFYKSDPFNSAKSTIYSTSSISSGHDFNSLGLYPCAMEKYSSKGKTDYSNVEDNLMKIGSSRLTYDIDLGWSHKGFDFVNCTTASATFPKDNILTTTVSTPYTTSYNPFNPEFHVPLVSSTSKKDNISKPSSSFVDTIASFYSQTSNLWSEEMPFYTSNSISSSKTFPSKHQNYLPLDHTHPSVLTKQSSSKQYETKQVTESCSENIMKTPSLGMSHQVADKYTKKSPSKMHINWMTSETRPMQNNSCNIVHSDVKDYSRLPYTQVEHAPKKQDQSDGNYFPISIHTYPSHAPQEEFQVWPSARPLGTTEVSIDPPPINLPTLVGDLALGPHEKKRQNAESHSRVTSQADIQQNCGNFLSVTQLMNRSTDNMSSRYHGTNEPAPKPTPAKQNSVHYVSEHNRKLTSVPRLDANLPQPCYSFNDSKAVHSYDAMNQFTNTKVKPSKSTDKSSKSQKHSYSAEALIRGNTYTQKLPDNKFVMPSQKYNDCNPQQDTSVAQVSHFPPIIDYVDNGYPGQQFSGTSIYNSTTNTISNSFYSNFMPGSSNLMGSNYTGAPFSSEFMDYNQSAECNNYPNQKYEEFKIKGNPPVFHHEKGSNNHKTSRREYTAKHKMDCSKKDSNKKYPSKRPKPSTEVEDWSDSGNLLWQNKTPSKRHPNLMTEELSFPNYVGNQMPSQYQPDIFNSHLMPPNVQSMGHNVDRSLTSFPPTSRANFNLSTLFPEITMKVQ